MIGPLYLRGDLVDKFATHLMEVPYVHVVHSGSSCLNTHMNQTIEQINTFLESFINSSFPIVCSSGSKSKVPFFDYHIALNYCVDKKMVYIQELIVLQPIHENTIKGILMAWYVLIYKEVEIEKMRIPFIITDHSNITDFEDVNIELDTNNNVTYLSRKKVRVSCSKKELAND